MANWSLMLKILITLTLGGSVISQNPDACWEPCFTTFGTENYIYSSSMNKILEVALEIAELKNNYNISRIGFLIDSSLSQRHLNNFNNVLGGEFDNGTNIFEMQIEIAKALTFIVHGVRRQVVQYDENGAWTCDAFTCLSSCGMINALNEQKPVAMGKTSHCPGNLEAACHLMNAQVTDYNCTGYSLKALAVAITNGDFFLNDPYQKTNSLHDVSGLDHHCPNYRLSDSSSEESSKFNFFSPCHSHFDSRYIIATNHATDQVQRRFASKHGHYKFIEATAYFLQTLKSVNSCMSSNCCTTSPTVTPLNCTITSGPRGEFLNPYPQHPALNGGQLAG